MSRLLLGILALLILGAIVLARTDEAAAHTRYAWASWYGPGLYGNQQACGGRLYTWTVGVAHKTLPCGSRVTICYRRCGTFRVIDRGPFIAGREFDLTAPARDRIGMRGGVVLVRWWRA